MSTVRLLPLAAFPQTELNSALYEEISSKMGWIPPGRYRSIVEREILVYDTFFLLCSVVGNFLTFGGGTLLNWVYLRNQLRFSFDIDSTYTVGKTSKNELLEKVVETVNHKIRKGGYSTSIGREDNEVELGTIVLDLEKDHFPSVLSLKRVMPCLETGAEMHGYLAKLGVKVDNKEILRARKEYGVTPKAEEVRIEIGFNQGVLPSRKKSVKPLIADHLACSLTRAEVTRPETIAALKIITLGKDRTDSEMHHALVDFVKALCDLRIVDHADALSITREVERLTGKSAILDSAYNRLLSFVSNVSLREWYEIGAQTQLIRKKYSFSELVRLSISSLEKVRGASAGPR